MAKWYPNLQVIFAKSVDYCKFMNAEVLKVPCQSSMVSKIGKISSSNTKFNIKNHLSFLYLTSGMNILNKKSKERNDTSMLFQSILQRSSISFKVLRGTHLFF